VTGWQCGVLLKAPLIKSDRLDVFLFSMFLRIPHPTIKKKQRKIAEQDTMDYRYQNTAEGIGQA